MDALVAKQQPPADFKPHERPGEKIGGGYFVVRRGRWGNRIKPHQRPFEHPDYASAEAECRRLTKKHPELSFTILADMKVLPE